MDRPDQSEFHDIADLSQLELPPLFDTSCGPGPVRRRRSSPRSTTRAVATENVFDPSQSWPSTSPFGYHRTSSSQRTPRDPRTHFSPSRVRFRNLLPVLTPSDCHNGKSDGCSD